MTQRRLNVGILETVHADAAIAARIAGKNLQDFADEALAKKSAGVIAEFKGNGKNGKRSRHVRRDTTAATSAQ